MNVDLLVKKTVKAVKDKIIDFQVWFTHLSLFTNAVLVQCRQETQAMSASDCRTKEHMDERKHQNGTHRSMLK